MISAYSRWAVSSTVVSSNWLTPTNPFSGARTSLEVALVATAIANAESRAELVASRARVVAAADETRRRIC